MVPEAGLEPARPCGQEILNLPCLPIPSLWHRYSQPRLTVPIIWHWLSNSQTLPQPSRFLDCDLTCQCIIPLLNQISIMSEIRCIYTAPRSFPPINVVIPTTRQQCTTVKMILVMSGSALFAAPFSCSQASYTPRTT